MIHDDSCFGRVSKFTSETQLHSGQVSSGLIIRQAVNIPEYTGMVTPTRLSILLRVIDTKTDNTLEWHSSGQLLERAKQGLP